MSVRDNGLAVGDVGVCSNADAPPIWKGRRQTRAVVGVVILAERDGGLFSREMLVEHLVSMERRGQRGVRWWTPAGNVFARAAELYAQAGDR